MLAKPILFAINCDAVTFELRSVPCNFGPRNAPFAEHYAISRLENVMLLVLPVARAADLEALSSLTWMVSSKIWASLGSTMF